MGGGDVIALVNPEEWNVEPQLAYARGWNKAVDELGSALKEARQLAIYLHSKHYYYVENWEPLSDIRGIISQIDNMVTGLEEKESRFSVRCANLISRLTDKLSCAYWADDSDGEDADAIVEEADSWLAQYRKSKET